MAGPSTSHASDAGSTVPFDLGAVMQQVHFAYRPSADGSKFEGGHSTYSVVVDESGLTLAPFHTPMRHVSAGSPNPEAGEVVAGAPFHVAVESIARGESHVGTVHAGTTRVESDGHLVVTRGDVEEHYRNGDEGVEQSWGFANAPRGGGEVVVRVKPSGLRYTGTSAKGLHFADPQTGVGVRYGHGTWIDANGVQTPVPARFENDSIELVVPERVVENSAYPAVLDPAISPEFGMDTPVAGPSETMQSSASVASAGSAYLVVWSDVRRIDLGTTDIVGARVGANGAVLDPSGFVISGAAFSQFMPSITSNGTDYFVVWSDGRNGATDIFGARVTAAGVVSDPDGTAISTAPYSKTNPSVAWGGANYLVVWEDARGGFSPWYEYDIYGARVASTGVVLDTSAFAIATASGYETSPSVGSNGSGFFVAWGDPASDLRGARVTSAGVVSDPSGVTISNATGSQSGPSVASDGTNYLVVWSDSRSGGSDIYGARVTAAAVITDATGFIVSSATNNQYNASIAFNGTGYLVAWTDLRNGVEDIYGARLTTGGVVSDVTGLVVSGATGTQTDPCVASNGSDYFVSWSDQRNVGTNNDIYGARVTSAGVVSDASGLALSSSANAQRSPGVASSDTGYLVVWHDTRTGGTAASDIYAVRVSPAGVIQDPSGILVSSAASDQINPRVASNGTDYFVAWQDKRSGNYDVYGARVTSGGVVSNASGVLLSNATNAQSLPRVASNGSDYLVVWEDRRLGATYPTVYAARVTSSAVVLDPGGFVATQAYANLTAPDVASDGTNYLVVWQDARLNGDVYGTRVTSGGIVADSAGLAIGATNASQYGPSVASNGTDYFVAWHEYRANSVYDVAGVHVSPIGVVSDALLLTNAANEQVSPTVAASGADYVVAWQDFRTGVSRDVYGAIVRGLTVESLNGTAFAADSESNELGPQLASGPSGKVLLVYTRLVAESSFNVDRVRARFVTFGSNPATQCSADSDCESGFCTDGVCCNTACGKGSVDCQACSIAAGAAVDGVCGVVVVPGTVCRAGTSACNPSETCNGISLGCPVDTTLSDGSSCNDGLGCTAESQCFAGVCQATRAADCSDSDPCTTDTCAEPRTCTHAAIPACVPSVAGGGNGGDGGTITVVVVGPDGGPITTPAASSGGGGCTVGRSNEPAPLLAFVFAMALVTRASRRATVRRYA